MSTCVKALLVFAALVLAGPAWACDASFTASQGPRGTLSAAMATNCPEAPLLFVTQPQADGTVLVSAYEGERSKMTGGWISWIWTTPERVRMRDHVFVQIGERSLGAACLPSGPTPAERRMLWCIAEAWGL